MNFQETMLKKLGQRKTKRIIKAIEDCLKLWMDIDRNNVEGIHNDEYCNAFGIMQGVAYALGYEYAAITTKEDMPGFWFDQLINKMKNDRAVYRKNFDFFIR